MVCPAPASAEIRVQKEERKSGPPIQMTRITKELAHTRPTQCFSAVFWIGGEKQDH
jgi:hypothetical protein